MLGPERRLEILRSPSSGHEEGGDQGTELRVIRRVRDDGRAPWIVFAPNCLAHLAPSEGEDLDLGHRGSPTIPAPGDAGS
jgi:hypothetical protein